MTQSATTDTVAAIQPGDAWTYRAPAGFEASRLVVGAVAHFPSNGPVICCAATHTPAAKNSTATTTIPFIALTADAFRASVVAHDGHAPLHDAFFSEFENWQSDDRGLRVFSVPFAGSLDRMIAHQMAEIANVTLP